MILLSVPDLSCAHCKASVEAALRPLAEVQQISVDLDARQVAVSGEAPASVLLAALDRIGFPAHVIAG
jgi:copper chaperone